MCAISRSNVNDIDIHITLLTLIFTTLVFIHNNCGLTADAHVQYKGDTIDLDTNNSTLELTELFSNVENSVVQITATTNVTDPFGSSLGSGFVYDKNGHIITNYHV